MEQDGFGCVVLDIGARYTKCGFAGESAPRAIFANPFKLSQLLTCTYNYQSDLSFSLDSNPDRNAELDPHSPLFQIALKNELFFHLEHIFFDKLFCAPKGLNILILTNILSPLFKKNLKPVLKSLLTQHFQAKKVTFMTSQEVAVLGTGMKDVSGLVIDCGFFETRIVPICFGITDFRAAKIIPLGSFHLMQKLAQEIKDANPYLNHHMKKISIDVFEDILSRICFFDNTILPDFTRFQSGAQYLDFDKQKFKRNQKSKKKFKCWKTSDKIADRIKFFDTLFTPTLPPHFLAAANNPLLKPLYPLTPTASIISPNNAKTPRSPGHSRSTSSSSFPTLTSPSSKSGSSKNPFSLMTSTPNNRSTSNLGQLITSAPPNASQQTPLSPSRKSSLSSASPASSNLPLGPNTNDPFSLLQKRRHTGPADGVPVTPTKEESLGSVTPRQQISESGVSSSPSAPVVPSTLPFRNLTFLSSAAKAAADKMIYRWNNNEINITKNIREKLVNEVFFSMEPENETNLAFAVLDVILNCDIIKRQHICSNIVVMGGTSMTFGFTQRLFQIMLLSIQNLEKYKILKQSTSKNFQKSKLNCSEHSIGWLGGSIYAVALQTVLANSNLAQKDGDSPSLAANMSFTPKTPSNAQRNTLNISAIHYNLSAVDLNLSFSPIPSPSSRLRQLSQMNRDSNNLNYFGNANFQSNSPNGSPTLSSSSSPSPTSGGSSPGGK